MVVLSSCLSLIGCVPQKINKWLTFQSLNIWRCLMYFRKISDNIKKIKSITKTKKYQIKKYRNSICNISWITWLLFFTFCQFHLCVKFTFLCQINFVCICMVQRLSSSYLGTMHIFSRFLTSSSNMMTFFHLCQLQLCVLCTFCYCRNAKTLSLNLIAL